MDPAIWICVFLPLIIILIVSVQHRKNILWYITRKRILKRSIDMSEIVKKFIGKTCLITTINSGALDGGLVGEIAAVEDNCIVLRDKKGESLINLDFVVTVKERKKG